MCDYHTHADPLQLFYQRKGDAAAVIMERGQRRRVTIREGEVCLSDDEVRQGSGIADLGAAGAHSALSAARGRHDGACDRASPPPR